jgi:hypothetical protein
MSFLWVNNVYTGAENRHGFSLAMNGATMRGGGEAPRQYAENHQASAREIARQPLAIPSPQGVGCRAPTTAIPGWAIASTFPLP